jgi:leader peptidase (prepilin peptidase)/N-methyltransferase
MTYLGIITRPIHRRKVRWCFFTVTLGVLVIATVHNGAAYACLFYIAFVTPELCRVDWAEHRLPNKLVAPGYVFVAFSVVWEWAGTAEFPFLVLGSAAGYLGVLFLFHLAGGMGMGDVKLAGLLGAGTGFISGNSALVSPVVAFILGGIVSTAILIRDKTHKSQETRIPFGPFLLAGFWVAVALTPLITHSTLI